jgi:predicted kinase
MFGVAETERLPADAYTVQATRKVYQALAAKAQRVIAAGHSAIVDAVFSRAEERDAIEAVAASAKIPFRGLFLTAGLATRLQRVGARRGDASDADAEVARRQERYEVGSLDWSKIDASGTPEDTLAHARAALAR